MPGCPHSLNGDPKTCSQCIGATPRMVTRDELTGRLAIDGKLVERGFVLASPPPRNVKRKRKPDPADADEAN